MWGRERPPTDQSRVSGYPVGGASEGGAVENSHLHTLLSGQPSEGWKVGAAAWAVNAAAQSGRAVVNLICSMAKLEETSPRGAAAIRRL